MCAIKIHQPSVKYLDFQTEVGITKHVGGIAATDELLSLCHIEDAKEFLNVGCGIGVGVAYIARKFGCRVVGVDISEKMSEWSRLHAGEEKVEDKVEFRFGWPHQIPLWLQMLGLAGMVLGMAFSSWAMVANPFFAALVRIQTDRGHTVVSAGPYRIMRHPGYADGLLADLSFPFLLGCLWAQIPIAIVLVLIIFRTVLEDRTLQAELPGYRECAARVRYRLLPGIW